MTGENLSTLGGALRWLAKRGFLSGSFGRGETSGKDIDIHLNDRYIQKLKTTLIAQKVNWNSPFVGSITWWPEGVQVETSSLFPRYRKGQKCIYGVWFKT